MRKGHRLHPFSFPIRTNDERAASTGAVPFDANGNVTRAKDSGSFFHACHHLVFFCDRA